MISSVRIKTTSHARMLETHNAYVLYGPSGAFYLDADDKLKMDVKGLVFRPAVRRKGGRIVAEFG